MKTKVKIGIAGLGKMGISHFAIANAHPLTDTVICDKSGFVLSALKRYTPVPTYKDYDAMLAEADLDAVIIATPSAMHGPMVRKALENGLHVFCEKPFCLDWREANALADLAEENSLVNQVGYHYRHVATFGEVKRLLDLGAIGDVSHVLAEAYGPVVLKPKGGTWRTKASEGGGCLYDYAAHPLNLVNWYFGAPEKVHGSVRNAIFSAQTEDEVYTTLSYPSNMSVHLSTNWSDDSYRKMATKLTLNGTKGRIFADRLEVQVYLREISPGLEGYHEGWNVKYLTDFDTDMNYYLRGEEYSGQIDDFVRAIAEKRAPRTNSFKSAAETDRTLSLITEDAPEIGRITKTGPQTPQTQARSWFGKN